MAVGARDGKNQVSGFAWILEIKPEQKLDWAQKVFLPLDWIILTLAEVDKSGGGGGEGGDRAVFTVVIWVQSVFPC